MTIVLRKKKQHTKEPEIENKNESDWKENCEQKLGRNRNLLPPYNSRIKTIYIENEYV